LAQVLAQALAGAYCLCKLVLSVCGQRMQTARLPHRVRGLWLLIVAAGLCWEQSWWYPPRLLNEATKIGPAGLEGARHCGVLGSAFEYCGRCNSGPIGFGFAHPSMSAVWMTHDSPAGCGHFFAGVTSDHARTHRAKRIGRQRLRSHVARQATDDVDEKGNSTHRRYAVPPLSKREEDLYDLAVELCQKKPVQLRVYRVFAKRTREEIALRLPRSVEELLEIRGIGDWKLRMYGQEVVDLVNSWLVPIESPEHPEGTDVFTEATGKSESSESGESEGSESDESEGSESDESESSESDKSESSDSDLS